MSEKKKYDTTVDEKWTRVVWRALQHIELTRREAMSAIRPQDSAGKSKMTAAHASCPHPKSAHRNGGNKYASYTYCTRCGLRLKYLSAEARAAVKAKKDKGYKKGELLNINEKSASSSPSTATKQGKPAPTSSTIGHGQELLMSQILAAQQQQAEGLNQALMQMMNHQQELSGALMQSMNHLTMSIQATSSAASAGALPVNSEVAPDPPPPSAQPEVPVHVETVDLTMDDSDQESPLSGGQFHHC